MSAEMGVRPIDRGLWNVIDATVRRLPSVPEQDGLLNAALAEVRSANRASSRAGTEGAEDASRTLEKLRDKVITYSEDSQPARAGGDDRSRVDLTG